MLNIDLRSCWYVAGHRDQACLVCELMFHGLGSVLLELNRYLVLSLGQLDSLQGLTVIVKLFLKFKFLCNYPLAWFESVSFLGETGLHDVLERVLSVFINAPPESLRLGLCLSLYSISFVSLIYFFHLRDILIKRVSSIDFLNFCLSLWFFGTTSARCLLGLTLITSLHKE